MNYSLVFKDKITREEIALLPRKKFEGEIFYINTPEFFREVLNELDGQAILGFDTETRPAFKKGTVNEVALLQLSTDRQAFLFRLKEIGLPYELARLLSNPRVIKAGVAIHDDIAGLQRLGHFEPEGFVELQEYVKDFGIADNGLKKLSANILGFQISKRQQTSNWDTDTLSQAQIEYAATDAWVCHQIYSRLQKVKRYNGHKSQSNS
jgi:ribonuclease D